ncbi:MAG: hypothetical protein AAGC53_13780 [Actinomycetota bacterium]
MSALAHVIEKAGIATVTLASTLSVAERMEPPRALWADFPLGRPLGHPQDAEFQHDVLRRAFALLDEASGPVLVHHPEVIEADETPLSCAIPPAFDANASAAAQEIRGIRNAYDRAVEARGATGVGRSITADEIEGAIEVLQSIVDGTPWSDAGIPGKNTISLVHDIRTYYEEAATELVDGPPPAGRAAEAWFYETTEAGKVVMAAREAIKDAEGPFPVWFYMAPGHR